MWLDGSPDQATFISWDVSDIPLGSLVQSASITINVVNQSNDTFHLYELLAPWVESEVTYVERSSANPWEVAGAQGASDRGTAALGSVTGPDLGEVVVTLNSAGVQVVQSWIDQPGLNYGIVFQNFDNASTDDLDFTSSEGSAQLRPKLTISYAPTAALSTLRSTTLHNEANPYDVNDDKVVSPLDVLVVANVLNQPELAFDTSDRQLYPDVSGDTVVSPGDALMIINYVNLPRAIGEGEAVPGNLPDIKTPFWDVRLHAAQSLSTAGGQAETANDVVPLPTCVPGHLATSNESANANIVATLSADDDEQLLLDLEEALQLMAEDLAKQAGACRDR